ncbi:ADAM family mig-17 [Biomphalaria pfeifferi]|uniref:ADAM family mig-17 n=1 Tax=Biomphalaria pfeifferi TaxID=112525 RepID=A0AAD8C9E6_BIOPF|nr:ADAM family mig-17 [Biomphalaria pfeifferi]
MLTLLPEVTSTIVNVNVLSRTEGGIPDRVQLTYTKDSTAVELNLEHVPHATLNVPVHTVKTLDSGQARVEQELLLPSQDIHYYQDVVNGAAVQINEIKLFDQHKSTFSVKGHFHHNGELHSIAPAQRFRRQSSPVANVRHVVKKATLTNISGREIVLQGEILEREARQSSKPLEKVMIDVLAVVDHSAFRRFERQCHHDRNLTLQKIREHYTFIVNGVDLMYRRINSTLVDIRIKLVKIIIIENYHDFPLHFTHQNDFKQVEGFDVLQKLSHFVKSNNLTEHSDHVMMFVGTKLSDDGSPNLLGISWLSSMCSTNGSSVSVVEDVQDYEVILTAAHELGHSLSAQHDNWLTNDCFGFDYFIMAPYESSTTAESNRFNPWMFSDCSIHYFATFISFLLETDHGRTCLTKSVSVSPDIPDLKDKYFGQVMPPEQQCRNTYGKGSYHCKVGYKSTEICIALYCYDPNKMSCFPQKALSGTECDKGKICRLGHCADNDHNV